MFACAVPSHLQQMERAHTVWDPDRYGHPQSWWYSMWSISRGHFTY